MKKLPDGSFFALRGKLRWWNQNGQHFEGGFETKDISKVELQQNLSRVSSTATSQIRPKPPFSNNPKPLFLKQTLTVISCHDREISITGFGLEISFYKDMGMDALYAENAQVQGYTQVE
ncbi:hypothetical protein [Thalassotalea mangrovi]|uniref:Uncharacterized protein n=1 Tax=Thalassotalea mangrovi TaxID=2572245 RepID=A0A4U1B6J5_9GAMM|nr:hypothetical protein [Thalassotalea mangrovi]TKB46164.1 hypothetical protein E8M12_05940 [Thalassotalea mangrovi]